MNIKNVIHHTVESLAKFISMQGEIMSTCNVDYYACITVSQNNHAYSSPIIIHVQPRLHKMSALLYQTLEHGDFFFDIAKDMDGDKSIQVSEYSTMDHITHFGLEMFLNEIIIDVFKINALPIYPVAQDKANNRWSASKHCDSLMSMLGKIESDESPSTYLLNMKNVGEAPDSPDFHKDTTMVAIYMDGDLYSNYVDHHVIKSYSMVAGIDRLTSPCIPTTMESVRALNLKQIELDHDNLDLQNQAFNIILQLVNYAGHDNNSSVMTIPNLAKMIYCIPINNTMAVMHILFGIPLYFSASAKDCDVVGSLNELDRTD